MRRFFLSLLTAVALLGGPAARADDTPRAVPLAVVIRGGASLGSFEAGALYELTEIARATPHFVDPKVLAGTSAGSINGLVTALTLFGAYEPAADAEHSLFYRTWIPIGTKGMFDAKAVSATGAFTRSGAMAKVVATIGAYARAGLRTGTDVVFAVPVTRLTPRNLDLDAEGALQVQQAGETFTVRLRGRGAGVLPSITNVHDPEGADVQPSLVTNAQGEVALQSLVNVVLASSAIPPAFGPVQIAHCLGTRKTPGPPVCLAEEAVTEAFVDGGFVDNLPLGLATRLTQHVVHADKEAVYLLVDPQEMTYARLPKKKQEGGSFQILGQRLAGGLLDAAQGVELRSVLDRDKRVGERLSVLQSELPLASSPLQSFLGFFETEFRTFDFALGMHEARRMAREGFRTQAFGATKATLPPLDGTSPMTRRVACLDAFLDGQGSPARCEGAELANFRALLQVSVERLYVQCARLDAASRRRLHADRPREAWCLSAARGGTPPLVPGVAADPEWRARKEEAADTFAYLTRRLHAYGFEWTDLELGKARAGRVRVEIALRVGEILRAFAAAQPQNSLLFRSAARALAQQLEYVPPSHAFHVLSGPSVELGYSVTRRASPWRSVRLASALVLDGIPSLITGDARSYFAMSPELGLEFEPPFLTTGNLQVRMLVRGGFQFSTGDAFLTDRTTPMAGTPLSRPVIDAAVAVSVLQWVRVQAGLATFPPFHGEPTRFTFRPGLGLQLDLPL